METGNLRLALSGSSLDNTAFVSGSATPFLGFLTECMNRSIDATWIEPRRQAAKVKARLPIGVKCLSLIENEPTEIAKIAPSDVLVLHTWSDRSVELAEAYSRTGAIIVLWDDCSPYAVDRASMIAKRAQIIISHSEWASTLLPHQHLPSDAVLVLPVAADIDRFQPVDGSKRSQQPAVTFVGRQTEERNDVIEELFFRPSVALSGYPFHLFGHDWENYSGLIPSSVAYLGVAADSSLAEIYATALVNLHGTRRLYRGTDILVGRVLEAMATGRPVLVDESAAVSQYFRVGSEVLHARNASEAEEIYRSFIADPESASKLGERGRAAIMTRHTWRHWVDSMMSAVMMQ